MRANSKKIAPGPKGHFLLGNGREFGKDALGYLMNLNREYGGVVRFKLGPKVAHLVTDPACVKHVLQENYKNYAKGKPYARARYAFGTGLITSDGERWRKQRKRMQPVFHKSHFDEFGTIMTNAIVPVMEQWKRKSSAPINIASDLRNMALRIAAHSLFTSDIDDESDWLQEAFNKVQLWFTRGSRTGYLIPPSVPLPANVRLRKTVAELHALIDGLIAKRRRTKDKPPDLLTMLLDARDEDDGSTMSDIELRDEVMTLLFAAHESTGSSMAWMLYLLSKYPQNEATVRAEVKAVAGDRRPTFADLPGLVYTKQVAEETMRLYPAAPIIPRDVLAADEIDGFTIPAKSVVFLSPYVTHRDPRSWDNPEAFDPDRFSIERTAARHRFSYLPFVLGPRQCIGNHFAMTEMLLAAVMVFQRFRFQLVPGLQVSSAHMRFDEGMYMAMTSLEGE